MKRLYFILFMILTSMVSFSAVTVRLKTGQTITGDIVFQNEEVLIIKSEQGQRYQYPKSEVAEINESTYAANKEKEQVNTFSKKKVGISFHFAGGAGVLPSYSAGGSISADVFIGACNLFDKHIFLGGGIGYEAFFMPDVEQHHNTTYSFIPLQLRFSAPFTTTVHAPAIGFSVGYGFSPKGANSGGLSADFDFGWRYQISHKAAMFAGLTTAVQQGRINYLETISDVTYSSSPVFTFWKVGAKVALQF